MPDSAPELFEAPKPPRITDPQDLPDCRHGHREALPCPWCDGAGDCAYRSTETTPAPLCGTNLLVPCPSCRDGCVYFERARSIKQAKRTGSWADGEPYDNHGVSVLDDPWDAWEEPPPPERVIDESPHPPLHPPPAAEAGAAYEEPEPPAPEPEDYGVALDEDGWAEPGHWDYDDTDAEHDRAPPRPAADPLRPVPLNDQQAKAVEHFEGPALIIAGAGSGKTRVLTQRVLRLLERRVRPSSICAVTFTRKAASEMKKRIAERNSYGARNVTISTFHSLALSICRDEPEGIGREGGFSVWDDKMMSSEMRRIIKELWKADKKRNRGRPPAATPVLQLIGRRKNAAADPCDEDFLAWVALRVHPVCAAAIQEYEATKEAANAVDYDDMIWSCVRMFERDEELLDRYRDRWHFWLVDEYQDTNDLQERFLSLLAGDRQNLMVVGDEDQAIYGFRAANVDHILTFPQRYPGSAVIELGQNYRSTERIVSAAARIIRNNVQRRPKELWTENSRGWKVEHLRFIDNFAEARYIARQLLGSLEAGYAPEEHAVLVRTRRQLHALQAALVNADIPHATIGALELWQRADVKLVLAWLKSILNPRDFASGALCMASWPRLGAKTVHTWQKAARGGTEPMWHYLGFLLGQPGCGAHTRRGESILALRKTVDAFGALFREGTTIRGLATWLYEHVGLDAEIKSQIENSKMTESQGGHDRRSLREQFLAMCPDTQCSDPYAGLSSYLDTLLLHAGRDRDTPKVRLSTIHSAKGLEWDHVWVAGMVEGILPILADDSDIEEERRLAYVAITRGRKRVVCTRFDQRTGADGRPHHVKPSRFILESASPVELVQPDRSGGPPRPVDPQAQDADLVKRARDARHVRERLGVHCAVCRTSVVDAFGIETTICPACRRSTPLTDHPLAQPSVRSQAQGLLHRALDPDSDADLVKHCTRLIGALGYAKLPALLRGDR